MLPLVSIIIPCYNAGPFIGEAIRSCLKQTWRNLEVLVIDDGSQDGSYVSACALSGERVRVFRNPGKGPCAARNFGVREARGQYLQFLDADDLLHPCKLEQQLSLRQPGEELMIGSSWYVFSGAFDRTKALEGKLPAFHCDATHWVRRMWLTCSFMPIHGWITPSAVARRIGPWDETLTVGDDTDYFVRAVLACQGVRVCREAEVYYRRGLASSLSRKADGENKASELRALKKCGAQLLTREDTAENRRAFACALSRFRFLAYPKHPALVAEAEDLIGELGGSHAGFPGRRFTRMLARVVGWRRIRDLQERKTTRIGATA